MQAVEDKLVVRMEAALAKFERQMARGRKVAVDSAQGSSDAWKRAGNQIAANANRATTGLQRLTNVSGAGRFVLQNTANQIGDIAVQMGSGTNAARAFGQQMPQLLGGFGAMGGTLGVVAPLLGTVAALGIPVAAALFSMGEEAQTAEERIKALKDSISELDRAQGLSVQSAGDLLDQYGGLADEARKVFEINRQIASIRAQGALDDVARGVASDLGVEGVFGFGPEEIRNLEDTIAALETEREELSKAFQLTDEEFAAANKRIDEISESISALQSVRTEIGDIGDALGVTDEAAASIVEQFAAVGQARGPREQAQAMSDLADFIFGASNNLKDASEEGEELYDRLREAVIQALELAKIDIAGEIGKGADEAARLADNLARARAEQIDGITGGNPDFFDPRNESGHSGQNLEDRGVPKQNRPGLKPPKSRSGGGRSARLPDEMREAQRLFQDTRTDAEKYAAEVERINELHRLFPEVVTEEVRDRALGALNQSAKNLKQEIESVNDAFA